MKDELEPVGLKEAKDHLSDLTNRVNFTGKPLTITKNGSPWVQVRPADPRSESRRDLIVRFHALTKRIEMSLAPEPPWDESISDKELLAQERAVRFE